MICSVENYNISAILDKISNRLLGRRKKTDFSRAILVGNCVFDGFFVFYSSSIWVKKPLASHKYGEENLI